MNDLTARSVNEYRLEIGEDYQQSILIELPTHERVGFSVDSRSGRIIGR
jgi:hypothetical protein